MLLYLKQKSQKENESVGLPVRKTKEFIKYVLLSEENASKSAITQEI